MSIFGRDRIARAAQEIFEHANLIENVKALQTGQKELADALKRIDERLKAIEIEFRALKAETRSDALAATQNIVNAVQGNLHQRIQYLAVEVAVLKHGLQPARRIDGPADSTKSFPTPIARRPCPLPVSALTPSPS